MKSSRLEKVKKKKTKQKKNNIIKDVINLFRVKRRNRCNHS